MVLGLVFARSDLTGTGCLSPLPSPVLLRNRIVCIRHHVNVTALRFTHLALLPLHQPLSELQTPVCCSYPEKHVPVRFVPEADLAYIVLFWFTGARQAYCRTDKLKRSFNTFAIFSFGSGCFWIRPAVIFLSISPSRIERPSG